MSRTPEVIINRPLQVLHRCLGFAGALFLLVAVLALAQGGNFIGPLILSILAFAVCSKIKFRWEKQAEVGVFK
ncbi:hypothetical protein GIW81_08460 [Hyphomicrobium sp. xq]|uniref:Uncharacterized protein n=1 Tax=Hyphomicrobium album TaxID=2665159 RepID=A0A6I3KFK1_9HYPH|nr:hypothetical protein [Hyphomicrobium album]MTD94365.1 hypothetical protein [Hyphomicrobium album]